MALDPKPVGADDRAETLLIDHRRKAHRVYRKRGRRDRFNPFRHIAWYNVPKDLVPPSLSSPVLLCEIISSFLD